MVCAILRLTSQSSGRHVEVVLLCIGLLNNLLRKLFDLESLFLGTSNVGPGLAIFGNRFLQIYASVGQDLSSSACNLVHAVSIRLAAMLAPGVPRSDIIVAKSLELLRDEVAL